MVDKMKILELLRFSGFCYLPRGCWGFWGWGERMVVVVGSTFSINGEGKERKKQKTKKKKNEREREKREVTQMELWRRAAGHLLTLA